VIPFPCDDLLNSLLFPVKRSLRPFLNDFFTGLLPAPRDSTPQNLGVSVSALEELAPLLSPFQVDPFYLLCLLD